jgi:hypothetical protein
LLGEVRPEKARVLDERRLGVVPGRQAGEDEIVQGAEEAQRQIPAQVRRNPVNTLVAGEPAAERCIER